MGAWPHLHLVKLHSIGVINRTVNVHPRVNTAFLPNIRDAPKTAEVPNTNKAQDSAV